MALKTLQKKYDELLKVFEQVGVTLTESQKESLDTFMLDFQAKLNETRDNAIKATKKIVEERMEKEYKEVFESIRKHQQEVFEKSSRLDVLKSQKMLTEAVDLFLEKHVEEVLPKKTLVDYRRMQKLEQVQESLKGMLLVNDDAVEKKVAEVKTELENKMVGESKELKDKLAKCEKVISESTKKNEELTNRYESLAKKVLIQQKTKNLPIVESQKVQKRLQKLTAQEIEKNFKTILESVQEETRDEQEKVQEEKNLEEAISDLLEGKTDSDKTGSDADKGTENNADGEVEKKAEDASLEPEEGEEGAVQVTESMMQAWIETLERITPKN